MKNKHRRRFTLSVPVINIRSHIDGLRQRMGKIECESTEWDILDVEIHMLSSLLQNEKKYITIEEMQSFDAMLHNPVQRSHYLSKVSARLFGKLMDRQESGILDDDVEGIYIRKMHAGRELLARQIERARMEAGILLPF